MSSPTLRVQGDGREPKTTHTQGWSNDASVPGTQPWKSHTLAEATNKWVINFFSTQGHTKLNMTTRPVSPLCGNLRTQAMAQSLQDELLPPCNEICVRLFPMPSINLCMLQGVVQSDEVKVTTEETKMSISDTPDRTSSPSASFSVCPHRDQTTPI